MRDEYECHLRTLLADAELAVRVPLDALAAILRDGRFKTRHEAGVHSKNPERCPAEESAVWSVHETALSELPIFGYAASIGDVTTPETRATLHQAYGSARVLLARDVGHRTSVFFGDTLIWLRQGAGAPAPLREPDELSWPSDRGAPTERHSLDSCGPDEVVEIQVVGGLRLSDIASIMFDQNPPRSILEALQQNAIDSYVNALPALPRWLSERFIPDALTLTH